MGGHRLHCHHGRQPVAARLDGGRLRPAPGLFPDPGDIHHRLVRLPHQFDHRGSDHRAHHAGVCRRHHSTPGHGDHHFGVSVRTPGLGHGALRHGGDAGAQLRPAGRGADHRRADLASHFYHPPAAGGDRVRHGLGVHAVEKILTPPARLRLDRLCAGGNRPGLPDDRHRQRPALGLGFRRHIGAVHHRLHRRRRLHLLAGPRQGAATGPEPVS